MVCVQISWIVPAIVIHSSQKDWKAWTQEYFQDWRAQGVEVKIIMPKKKQPARIVFIFPKGTYEKFNETAGGGGSGGSGGSVEPIRIGQSGSSTTDDGVEMVNGSVEKKVFDVNGNERHESWRQ